MNEKCEAVVPRKILNKMDFWHFDDNKFVCLFFWFNRKSYTTQEEIKEYFSTTKTDALLLKYQMEEALKKSNFIVDNNNQMYQDIECSNIVKRSIESLKKSKFVDENT